MAAAPGVGGPSPRARAVPVAVPTVGERRLSYRPVRPAGGPGSSGPSDSLLSLAPDLA